MTLSQLYDLIDWSEIDKAKAAWEASHPSSVRLNDSRDYRMERLYLAVQELESGSPGQAWKVLPSDIRRQVANIYSQNGLLENAT